MKGLRNAERFQSNVISFANKRKTAKMEALENEIEEMQVAQEAGLVPKRVGKLKSAQDVRRYMARLMRRTEQRKLDVNRAYKLGCMASMLLKAIETTEIEERLAALEVQEKEPETTKQEQSEPGEQPTRETWL